MAGRWAGAARRTASHGIVSFRFLTCCLCLSSRSLPVLFGSQCTNSWNNCMWCQDSGYCKLNNGYACSNYVLNSDDCPAASKAAMIAGIGQTNARHKQQHDGFATRIEIDATATEQNCDQPARREEQREKKQGNRTSSNSISGTASARLCPSSAARSLTFLFLFLSSSPLVPVQ